jgi:hypothetical protein
MNRFPPIVAGGNAAGEMPVGPEASTELAARGTPGGVPPSRLANDSAFGRHRSARCGSIAVPGQDLVEHDRGEPDAATGAEHDHLLPIFVNHLSVTRGDPARVLESHSIAGKDLIVRGRVIGHGTSAEHDHLLPIFLNHLGVTRGDLARVHEGEPIAGKNLMVPLRVIRLARGAEHDHLLPIFVNHLDDLPPPSF